MLFFIRDSLTCIMKKLSKLKTLVLLTAAFAATGAGLEWIGYSTFDKDDGTNVLCDIDPSCRTLTEGEIELARSVFGNSIDYSKIKIFNRSYMYISWIDQNHAPNGNIYIPDKWYQKDDFSKHTNSSELFIHEMVHVWQHQNGLNPRAVAIKYYLTHNFNYMSASDYQYKIEEGKTFFDYNQEQQAEIVVNYMRTLRTFDSLMGQLEKRGISYNEASEYQKRSIRAKCEKLAQLKIILAPVIASGESTPAISSCNLIINEKPAAHLT